MWLSKTKKLKPRIWIVPHALLTRKSPTCISEVAALIIDEDPLQNFLGGCGHPVRVSMDELRLIRSVPAERGNKKTDEEESADLANTTALLLKAVENAESGNSTISAKEVLELGLTKYLDHAA